MVGKSTGWYDAVPIALLKGAGRRIGYIVREGWIPCQNLFK